MLPLCSTVPKSKCYFTSIICLLIEKLCSIQTMSHILRECTTYFLNAVCLEWSEVAEWPISFPIMKNQSAPDRGVFIQSGLMWNDFWWPLFMSHSWWNASSSARCWSLSPPLPPTLPSGLIFWRVADWISHLQGVHTLTMYTITWWSKYSFLIHIAMHNLLLAPPTKSSTRHWRKINNLWQCIVPLYLW